MCLASWESTSCRVNVNSIAKDICNGFDETEQQEGVYRPDKSLYRQVITQSSGRCPGIQRQEIQQHGFRLRSVDNQHSLISNHGHCHGRPFGRTRTTVDRHPRRWHRWTSPRHWPHEARCTVRRIRCLRGLLGHWRWHRLGPEFTQRDRSARPELPRKIQQRQDGQRAPRIQTRRL